MTGVLAVYSFTNFLQEKYLKKMDFHGFSKVKVNKNNFHSH